MSNPIREEYMRRAIELAQKGLGWTNPNPLVGAVIVKNDRIIGEGYHARCGELHAERNAIANLSEDAEGATIYVTLEPCCHYGKTPPCTEAIIENKIARVVIGSRDPNPKVSGKGAQILRESGIEVVEDYLREECDTLNSIFFHYITTSKPYVVMKYAMTADGKIATRTGASKWITGPKARERVQEYRKNYMGIMVGIATVLADDPMLNARIEGARQPIRMICDSKLRIPVDSQIVQTAKQYPVIVACALSEQELEQSEKVGILRQAGVEVVSFPDRNGIVDLDSFMSYLGKQGIDSILLEGGGTLNEAALAAGIVKEVKCFVAPKMFGGSQAPSPVTGLGVETPEESYFLLYHSTEVIDDDVLITYLVKGR